MKNLSLLGCFMLCLAIVFTSCGDETLVGGSANPPIVEFLDNGNGSVTNDVQVAPGSVLTFSLSALSGDNPMQNIRFLEDGVLVTDYATRITIDGSSATSANVLLFDGDKTSFTKEITWVTQADQSSRTYAIEVVDEAQNSDSEAVIVTTVVNTVFSFSFTESAPYTWSDITTGADNLVSLQLNAVQGAYDLSTLSVYEDNVLISDVTRLRKGVVTTDFDSNPLTLANGEENGFIMDVWVKAHSGVGVTKAYRFQVEDTNGDVLSVEFNISTPPPASDITTQTGVLLNAAGPTGTGGLNLATGMSTGSANGDIIDSGIDLSLPDASNWIQRIAPGSNSILTTAPSSSDFPTSFDDVQYQSEIQNAYNLSTQISQSQVVNIGDVFLVNNGVNTFMIKCTNVNVTAADNNDSYTFSVKY